MPRLRARVDGNQKELVRQLRGIGCSVAVTSQLGKGFPDIVVGYRGVNYLCEIKDPAQPPSKKKLTEAEDRFSVEWRGQYCVIESLEDFLSIIG